jgi:hypothetical protein
VGIDCSVITGKIIPPYRIEKLFAGKDLLLVPDEELEQFKLLGAEINKPSVNENIAESNSISSPTSLTTFPSKST